jgi:hypothetical protein
MFFAEQADIRPIIEKLEMEFAIKYYLTGMFDSPDVSVFESAFDIPNFGVSNGDWIKDDAYLLMSKSNVLNIREVPQRKGGIKFVIDGMINRATVRVVLGGVYPGEMKVLVAGFMDTNSDEKVALDIFKFFSKSIKKEFKKISDFYVGMQAESYLKGGWRLVLDYRRSREYDLTFE